MGWEFWLVVVGWISTAAANIFMSRELKLVRSDRLALSQLVIEFYKDPDLFETARSEWKETAGEDPAG